MKKRVILLVTALCVLLTVSVGANVVQYLTAEVVDYPVIVNGVEKAFKQPVVTINDRTYLPLREMCDVLGIDIEWSEEEQNIIIKTDEEDKTISKPHTLSDFSFITYGMELEKIFDKIGEPDHYTGSGFLWGVYVLDDGSEVHLHDFSTGKVERISLVTPGGELKTIEFKEDGTLNTETEVKTLTSSEKSKQNYTYQKYAKSYLPVFGIELNDKMKVKKSEYEIIPYDDRDEPPYGATKVIINMEIDTEYFETNRDFKSSEQDMSRYKGKYIHKYIEDIISDYGFDEEKVRVGLSMKTFSMGSGEHMMGTTMYVYFISQPCEDNSDKTNVVVLANIPNIVQP